MSWWRKKKKALLSDDVTVFKSYIKHEFQLDMMRDWGKAPNKNKKLYFELAQMLVNEAWIKFLYRKRMGDLGLI